MGAVILWPDKTERYLLISQEEEESMGPLYITMLRFHILYLQEVLPTINLVLSGNRKKPVVLLFWPLL
jgi:hypothetical protein